MSREPNRPPLLALNHVTVIRGERAALDDLSLRIEAGEHICILGPNGCGKSTLIKTITRECYPLANEQSSMSILGRECWDIFELRSRLALSRRTCWLRAPVTRRAATWCSRAFSSSTRIF